MVKDHLKQYELALEEFMKSHIEYHKTLTVSEEITESNDYALSVQSDADRFRQRVVKFILENITLVGDQIQPEDSVSQTSSSTSSARIKVAARKAALAAKAAALKIQQALENEELNIKQRKEKLEIETDIAMT